MTIPTDQTELRDVVRAKYAAAATITTDGTQRQLLQRRGRDHHRRATRAVRLPAL